MVSPTPSVMPRPTRQRGMALFIALVFLLILTLLGLTSSNVGLMQERMAGNVTEYNVAFQRAEAVLRDVEDRLRQPSPGLSNIVAWRDIPSLVLSPADCSLETNFGDVWDNLGSDLDWEVLAPGQYAVVELSEYRDADDLRRISCRLEDGLTYSTGAPVPGEHYLILAKAYGPGDPDRRARALVQSIFWWPR